MEAIKNILVPVDFSNCSLNALSYALQMVDVTGGEIIVLHAYHVPFAFPEAGNAISPKTIDQIEKNVDDEFYSIKEQFRDELHKIREFKKVASFGIDAINSELKNQEYDLIVMGTKGASGISEVLIGSVAANVIEEANSPVLCIPEQARYNKIRNIAFACDYEEMHEPREIGALRYFAKKYDACIHLLNVKEKSRKGHFEEAIYLDTVFSEVKHTHNTSRFEKFEAGINDFIDSNEVDMLAIMPRRKNVLKKLFSKSHTRQMAYHSRIPLLAFHE